MGAFGSCLGVGRPVRPGANPRLLASNLVNADAGALRNGPMRPNSYARDISSISVRSPMQNGFRGPSNTNQHQHIGFNHHSPPSMIVPNLIEIEDNVSMQPSSHLICNRKQFYDEATDPVTKLNQDIRLNPAERRIFIALYDYESKNDDDLAFVKGEQLETTTKYMTDNGWWLARSVATKKVGYVPSNYIRELKTVATTDWFFNDIRRADAETLLRMPENKDGAFIVRISQTGGTNQYSLSLKHDNVVKHYRIVPYINGGFYINKKKIFPSLEDLVQHYSAAPDGLCINLREPCKTVLGQPRTLTQDNCDPWEIDKSRIQKGKEIGRGQFGQVFEGLMFTKDGKAATRVAIKTLKPNAMDPADFLAEAQIMKRMKHKHLVSLFAVCTQTESVYIITELMSKGALLDYLKTSEGKNLHLQVYIKMATQIAEGMHFLERENFIHRDLAARNILVGDNQVGDIVCKIADFGLARFIKETEYEAHTGARFPIKWTAPEAANHSKFSIKSDVWSFGVVLYEIITKGEPPYPDMSNAEVLSKIDRGFRMPQPIGCEDKYYGIMKKCWHKDPLLRPTFHTLNWELDNYFSSDEQYKEASQFLNP